MTVDSSSCSSITALAYNHLAKWFVGLGFPDLIVCRMMKLHLALLNPCRIACLLNVLRFTIITGGRCEHTHVRIGGKLSSCLNWAWMDFHELVSMDDLARPWNYPFVLGAQGSDVVIVEPFVLEERGLKRHFQQTYLFLLFRRCGARRGLKPAVFNIIDMKTRLDLLVIKLFSLISSNLLNEMDSRYQAFLRVLLFVTDIPFRLEFPVIDDVICRLFTDVDMMIGSV
ncbi:hypothetical protein Tco_0215127 [Tanacetum coccineum]